MLQHKAGIHVKGAGSKVSAARRCRIVVARAASSFQTGSAGESEALRGVKVVNAADGFEVDLLSLWQVGKN